MCNYFVDFENTGLHGLECAEEASENDVINIFFNENIIGRKNVNAIRTLKTRAKVNIYNTEKSAKNRADFQICTLLGNLIAKQPDSEFVLLTKDQGFDAAVDFWKNYNVIN